jgi:hypothetical protein
MHWIFEKANLRSHGIKSHKFLVLFFKFFDQELNFGLKTTLLRLKEKTNNSTPLLPTSVTPLQHLRWCWNFEKNFYTFQTKTDLILTQIQWWIWEEQLLEVKSRGFVMEFLPWTPPQHPLLLTNAPPWLQLRWCWNFGRAFYTFWTKNNLILTQIQRWIWEE